MILQLLRIKRLRHINYEFFHIFTEIAIHDIGTEDSEYALDYLYTHNDEEWRSRKIAIGRRRNRFEVKMHFS